MMKSALHRVSRLPTGTASFLLIMAGCSAPADRAETAVATWTLAPEADLSIGVLEGEAAYLLDRVRDATVLRDGRVAIVNGGSNEIRFFTAEGVFDGASGGDGDGPGEFRNLAWIRELPDQRLAAFDPFQRRTSYFDRSGAFVESVPLPSPPGLGSQRVSVESVFDDGRVLVYFPEDRIMIQPDALPEYTLLEGNLVYGWYDADRFDTVGIRPSAQTTIVSSQGMFVIGPAPLGRNVLRASNGTRAVIAQTDRLAVATLTSESTSFGSILAHGEFRELGEAEWRLLAGDYLDTGPSSRRHSREKTLEEFGKPEFVPLFDKLVLDRVDRIWLRSLGMDAELRRWQVLDHEGALMAWADISPAIEIMEIGEDYVVGVVKDDLDVESVRRWALRR